jgi:hypothetical protein
MQQAHTHLIWRQDLGLLMFESRLLKPPHRVSWDHFEKVMAKAEEAPSNSKVIVDVDGGKILRQRSQPRVEFSMGDAIDRVPTVTGDKTIEHDLDLGMTKPGLLMAGDPQTRAVAHARIELGRTSVHLPFGSEKTLPLERDDVRERFRLIFEVSSNAFRTGHRLWDRDHERRSGFRDSDDFDAAHAWSLLVAASDMKSSLLCSSSFFSVSAQDYALKALTEKLRDFASSMTRALKPMRWAIWNVEMTHRPICFPDFPAVWHVRRYSCGTGKDEKQIGRARRVPIEAGPLAFRESQSGKYPKFCVLGRFVFLRSAPLNRAVHERARA